MSSIQDQYIKRKVDSLIDKEGEDFKLVYNYKESTGDISSPSAEVTINTQVLKEDAWSDPRGYIYETEVAELDVKSTKIITTDFSFNPLNVSLERSTLDTLADITALTLVINSESVNITQATTIDLLAYEINNSSINGVGAFVDDGYLVIYSSNSLENIEYEVLTLSGSALTNMGFTAGAKKERAPKILARGREYYIKDILEGKYKKTLILRRV